MPTFIKRPVEVEAFRLGYDDPPEWLLEAHSLKAICNACITVSSSNQFKAFVEQAEYLKIDTLEGEMTANRGDWIIKGVEGEVYPCKDSVFRATYAPVESALVLSRRAISRCC